MAMSRILRNLVLLILVVELVLPVGWCCRPVHAAADPSAAVGAKFEARKSCCHQHQSQTEKPGRSHSPTVPASKCCCSADSVVPEKVAPVAGIDSMLILPLTLPLIDAPRDELCRVASGAVQTGPPLNVLLCVWLC